MKNILWRAAVLLAVLAGSHAAHATTYSVDRTDDVTGGACTAAANDCSLRSAIVAANANAGVDTVVLQNGTTYTLSLGTADSTPGAFVEDSGDLDITDDLIITGNGATVSGGGIDRVFDIGNEGGTSINVAVDQLTITGGNPTGFLSFGGGINVRAAALTLTNCTVSGNTTNEGGAYDNGGGIAVNSLLIPLTTASLSLTNCTVSNNSGQNGGGIVLGGTSTATILHSTIGNNNGYGDLGGGGLFVAGTTASATIKNSTVAVNTARVNGGGVFLYNGSATVAQATVALNTAAQGGGALPQGGTIDSSTNGGSLTSSNSLWANTAASYPELSGTVTSNGFNLWQSSSGITGVAGSDLINQSALLSPAGLANNGGPTQTIDLQPASPAINAGSNALIPSGVTTDQRGHLRVVPGGIVDIGALETNGITINNATVTEGNSGTVNAVFTVTLPQPNNAQTVTVDYATAPAGSYPATADVDYVTANGTLSFAPGETSKTITVQVKGDTLYEGIERLVVNLSNPVNYSIEDGEGFGTITDDDAKPSISIDDVSLLEGDAGTKAFNFTVSLSTASGLPASVKYATGTPSGIPATAGVDYTAIALTTLTFAPGETSKTVTVYVIGDNTIEGDERFSVKLSSATNATIADNEGIGTILDNDARLAINNVIVTEGNSGTVDATFTVSLTGPSPKTITVQYSTGTLASVPATSGVDYVAVPLTTLTFAPGETTKTVTVKVIGDLLNEVNENFAVNLSNPTNATFNDSEGICTITDDDAAPSLSINDVTLAEGNSGTTAFNFTVSLSAASGKTVTVKYATATPSGNPATAGDDYTAIALTTLTFAPGETTKTVTVLVNGDTTVEVNEKFSVKLSSASNATIADNEGIGTITNDDAGPLLAPVEEPSK